MSDDYYHTKAAIEAQTKLSIVRWWSLMAFSGAIAFIAFVFLLVWSTKPDRPTAELCRTYAVPGIDKNDNAILVFKDVGE